LASASTRYRLPGRAAGPAGGAPAGGGSLPAPAAVSSDGGGLLEVDLTR
jgi:hypothetical protein